MNKMRLGFVVLICCAIVVMSFIFFNSTMSSEKSMRFSNFILRVVLGNKRTSLDELRFGVRKLAHIVEFWALGLLATMINLKLKKSIKKDMLGFVLFGVLSVGVVDEYIQSFFGRGSSLADVLIDFCGGLIGICFAYLISCVFESCKRKSTQA